MQNVSSSNSQAVNVPKLRFPNFTKEWNKCELSSFFKKISTKNKDGKTTNVISNSAKNGLIPQTDYFDKEIANSENTSGYYIINKGDFVYNPRKSTEAPFGPISVYDYENTGIVSPLYLCFKPQHEINTTFFKWMFKSPVWHRYIYMSGDSGARHDRVSMRDEVFFSMPLSFPEDAEQGKIANLLSLVEKRIEKQQTLVDNLKLYKRGVLSAVFDRRIRFKRADGSSYPNWSPMPFGSIIEEYNDRTKVEDEDTLLSAAIEGMFLNSELFGHQRGSSNIGYKKIKKGTLVLSTQNLHLGNANVNLRFEHGMVSPAYKTYHIIGCSQEFLYHWINREETKQFFFNATTVGASACRRNVEWDTLYEQVIEIPSAEEESVIVKYLSCVDVLCKKHETLLTSLYGIKKSLLKQLFI